MSRFTIAALLLALGTPATAAAQSPAPAPPSNVTCSTVQQPFTGTICMPKGDGGKHPAAILLGGSEGGNSMSKAAAAFAEHGYVAASVAYFRAPGLPAALVDIPVETVGHALDAIAARSDVDSSHIGLLGISKGGELALLAASTYPKFKAVVAVVPSPFAYFGLSENNIATGCSWSRDGKPLPCVPADAGADQAIGMAFYRQQPVILKTLYDASREADPAATKAAYFPLERIAGPVLCLSGRDDRLWNSPAQCDLAMTYLKKRGHPYADRAIAYRDAGHTFLTATRGPSSAITEITLGENLKIEFGGTKQGDADAARAAWPAIWNFFAARLRR